MGLVLDTAPSAYPVTLEEAKIHLRLADLAEEDSIVSYLITAATEQAEAFTQRRFITQTWKLLFDSFPSKLTPTEDWPGAIRLPYPPLQSITHVKYYDTNSTQQTLTAGTNYVVDTGTQPGRIVPAPQLIWPSVQTEKLNAVEIKFVCGYGAAAAVPASIKAAILLILAHYYEYRQEVVTGTIVTKIPMASEWLLWPYRDLRAV